MTERWARIVREYGGSFPGGHWYSKFEYETKLRKTRQRPVTRIEERAFYEADPDEWVYKCSNGEEIIYVGITNSALRRFRQHSEGARWFRDVINIEVEHLPSRRAAEDREAELIRQLRPAHNLGPPRGGFAGAEAAIKADQCRLGA